MYRKKADQHERVASLAYLLMTGLNAVCESAMLIDDVRFTYGSTSDRDDAIGENRPTADWPVKPSLPASEENICK